MMVFMALIQYYCTGKFQMCSVWDVNCSTALSTKRPGRFPYSTEKALCMLFMFFSPRNLKTAPCGPTFGTLSSRLDYAQAKCDTSVTDLLSCDGFFRVSRLCLLPHLLSLLLYAALEVGRSHTKQFPPSCGPGIHGTTIDN